MSLIRCRCHLSFTSRLRSFRRMGYKYKFSSKSLGPQAVSKHNSRLESFLIASTTKLKSMSTALNSRIANTLLSGESNVELIVNKSKWNITLNECSAQNNFSKLLDDIVNHKFNGETYRQLYILVYKCCPLEWCQKYWLHFKNARMIHCAKNDRW